MGPLGSRSFVLEGSAQLSSFRQIVSALNQVRQQLGDTKLPVRSADCTQILAQAGSSPL